MARNLKLFFDPDGSPRVRGPSSEKILMAFLEADVQGSDHICHDLMDDLTAIEDESAESREFVGNAHSVVISAEGVTIECTIEDDGSDGRSGDQNQPGAHTPSNDGDLPAEPVKTEPKAEENSKPVDSEPASASHNKKPGTIDNSTSPVQYKTGLKHFREVLEDWEAFILDDQSPT